MFGAKSVHCHQFQKKKIISLISQDIEVQTNVLLKVPFGISNKQYGEMRC